MMGKIKSVQFRRSVMFFRQKLISRFWTDYSIKANSQIHYKITNPLCWFIHCQIHFYGISHSFQSFAVDLRISLNWTGLNWIGTLQPKSHPFCRRPWNIENVFNFSKYFRRLKIKKIYFFSRLILQSKFYGLRQMTDRGTFHNISSHGDPIHPSILHSWPLRYKTNSEPGYRNEISFSRVGREQK